jgi:hypothetical protein
LAPGKFIIVVFGWKFVQNLRMKIYPKSFGRKGVLLNRSLQRLLVGVLLVTGVAHEL